MANASIKVENLGKKYNLKHQQKNAEDSMVGAFTSSIRGLFNKNTSTSSEEFWALKDVSFSINQGDRVGIIGRNGAGKSTLLKLLSRIIKPTTGRIEYSGRMASLLEVGTGFHGDLSGRENIYLNGSILGMSKHEIDTKFDEIVAFSEVEKFLDTPVKRYSSGMYVRLAFAVAAHLESEILIVDEVLAVGDAAFQKKCLGKMNDISGKQGRTILFVSHSMDAVQKLCNRGILLNKGCVEQSGDIEGVINTYVSNSTRSNGYFDIEKNQLEATPALGKILNVSVLDNNGKIAGEIPSGTCWRVKIDFEITQPQDNFVLGFGLQGAFGDPLNTSWSTPQPMQPGIYQAEFANNTIYYNTGLYKLALGLSNQGKSYFYNDTEATLVISDASAAYETERIVNRSSGLLLNQLQVNIKRKE